MSVSYYIVCLDCKSNGIHLGKAIKKRYAVSEQETMGFSELDFHPEEKNLWSTTIENVECLDHYLMMHRNHHLIVVSDRADALAKNEGFPRGFPTIQDNNPDYSRKAFLNKPVSKPKPDEEVDALPDYVKEKIKNF